MLVRTFLLFWNVQIYAVQQGNYWLSRALGSITHLSVYPGTHRKRAIIYVLGENRRLNDMQNNGC